jgi:hemoglobin/transferrin/lactoferrin receptor protein
LSSSGLVTETRTLARYASAANERTLHGDVQVRHGQWTYFGSVSQSWMDDLRAGNWRNRHYKGFFERPRYAERRQGQDVLVVNEDPNLQVGSGYDLFNTLHKLKFRTGQNADLAYHYYFSTTSDIPRYDRLATTIGNGDSLAYAQWFYGPQTWQMHVLRFNSYHRNAFYDQARISLAYQDYEESRNNRDFGDDRLRTRTENVDVFSVNFDFDKTLRKGDLFYGLEWTYNQVDSDAFRKNINTGERQATGTRYPDGGSQYSTIAGYFNRVVSFHDRWTLNFGGRLSGVALQASSKNENPDLLRFDDINLVNYAVNGLLGLIHLPDEKTQWSWTFSTGFRAPNVDDVGKVFEFDENRDGLPVVVVPNEDLKPEYTYNGEMSFKKQGERYTLGFTAFYTWLTRPIVIGDFEVAGNSTVALDVDGDPATPRVTHAVRAQVNGDGAWIAGASFRGSYEAFRNILAYSQLTFSDGEETGTGEPLRHTTPLFGKAGLRWLHPEKLWQLEVYSEFSANRWRDEIPVSEIDDKPYLYTDRGSPGWYTLNIKSSLPLTPSLELNMGMENVLDLHYRPYSSGISAPGRNFMLAIRGNF